LYGVSVAEAMARASELARRNGVVLQGAVTWALEFEDQPVFAGFRELATGGKVDGVSYLVDKPVLNVFRMMAMMRGQALAVKSSGARPVEEMLQESVRGAPDVNAVAMRDERHVDVLVWNYHDDDVAAAPASVDLTVSGLPAGKIWAQRFLVDAAHSNAYAAWLKMGSPAQPSKQQFVALQKAEALEAPRELPVVVEDGRARVDVKLERQAVMLVRFAW
jgi:xylan 1,4-beta-xylosidase